LKAPTVHGGAFELGQPIRIETPIEPWAYAVSWRPSAPAQPRPKNILVAIRAKAIQGRFGVLIVSHGVPMRQVSFDTAEGLQTKHLAISHIDQTMELIIRNFDVFGRAIAEIEQLKVYANFDGRYAVDPDYELSEVTTQSLDTRIDRRKPLVFGSIATTEVCNLSCVMCHFNGPKALKKGRILSPETVERILDQIPAGEEVWFAATGEFFVDPHALDHLRAAVRRGFSVGVLSHGQFYDAKLLDEMLAIGVRIFRISADSINAAQFRKVRRGGELSKVVEAFAYLHSRKSEYPDIRTEVTCTLFSNTFARQKEFENFWSDKVDRILFNAEYFDKLKFRNILHQPKRRVNCEIKTYVVPSGHIAPCCAIMVYQHDGATSWLPHVDTHTLEEAYTELCDLYEDPESPLSKICRNCDWWIMWAKNEHDVGSAYCRWVDFPKAS
jgi:sulfatase maturation enzyme AslB (radical SAM superfamily)